MRLRLVSALVGIVLGLGGCGSSPTFASTAIKRTLTLPEFTDRPEQISKLCAEQRAKLTQNLDAIGRVAAERADFASTTLAIEMALADFASGVGAQEFLAYVSPDSKVRQAANACQQEDAKLQLEVWTRGDLYRAVKAFDHRLKEGKEPPLRDAQDEQLHRETLLSFKRSGLELSASARADYLAMQAEVVTLSAAFIKALSEDNSVIEVSSDRLKGLPDDFVRKLKLGKHDYSLQIPVNEATFPVVMNNADDREVRRQMATVYERRGGEANVARLKKIVELRANLAKLLGYRTFADYVTEIKMAGNAQNVNNFLASLLKGLKPEGERELGELEDLKRRETGDSGPIEFWDKYYYLNQLTKAQGIDEEEIKKYFPSDVVVAGMFNIYERLLGVRFVPAPDLKVWHPSVKAYRIFDGGRAIAIFYFDLVPRLGKYSHQASFSIIPAYQLPDGDYHAPCSAIVGNFNQPGPDGISLLSHFEVETLFHEFGHVMHQTLTTARYHTFSGTKVRRDFVEAPSQMMANWVWREEGLRELSGYFRDHSRKLPEDLVQKIVAARNVGVGLYYLRQLSFDVTDMQLHTSDGNLDPDEVFNGNMRDIALIPEPDGGHGIAGFIHLVTGYEAGVYGYLYSKVFAEDMFATRFSENLFDPRVGAEYRRVILEPGGTIDPLALVTQFLKRPPNDKAFLHSLGLN